MQEAVPSSVTRETVSFTEPCCAVPDPLVFDGGGQGWARLPGAGQPSAAADAVDEKGGLRAAPLLYSARRSRCVEGGEADRLALVFRQRAAGCAATGVKASAARWLKAS